MASKDIQATIDAIDPDKINWADPNAYAAMGVGEDDGDGEGANTQGDTPGAAPASATAATPAQAAPAVSSAPAPAAPGASSATPGAAASNAAEEDQRPAGVATRDGKHVIPYEVLQSTRDNARRLEQENLELRQRLEQAANSTGRTGAATEDLQERAAQGLLTEEERVDFPALAKIEQAFNQLNERLNQAPAPAAATPASAAPNSTESAALSEDEQYDMAIAANPLIAQWMKAKGPEWTRAVQMDRLLQQDPSTANLSYADRFARVQRSVAAEFGVPLPAAAPTPAPTPAKAAAPAAPQARAAAMPSLSDMGGAPPRSEEDELNQSTTTDLLARAEHMTDAQLRAWAGLGY